MFIRVGFDVSFTAPQVAPMLLVLRLHHTRTATIRKPEHLQVEPCMAVSEYIDCYGNYCGRVFAPAGRIAFRNDAIVEDCGLPDLQVPSAIQHNVQDLPDHWCSREMMDALDRYEGVPIGCYGRSRVEVETEDGERLQAETYVGGKRFVAEEGRPGTAYLQVILTGASAHRLPEQYIRHLLACASKDAP